MLLLTFGVGGCRYAVEATRVVAVVPRIALRPIPHAIEYLAGLFNLGGMLVPVVDLGVRLAGAPCQSSLSTRIILVSIADGRRLGLIAEQVTELRTAPDDVLAGRAAAPQEAAYLGPVLVLDGELVQVLHVDEILPESLRETLYEGMLGRS